MHLAGQRVADYPSCGKVLDQVGNSSRGIPALTAARGRASLLRNMKKSAQLFRTEFNKPRSSSAAEVLQKIKSNLLTVLREAEAPQEEQTVVQSAEQREAAAERVLPEEELEHGGLLGTAGPPVRVRHGELVQVGQEWRNPASEGPPHYRTRVCGRRCHVLQQPRCLGLEVRRQPSKRETVQGQVDRGGVCVRGKRCKAYRFFPLQERKRLKNFKKIQATVKKVESFNAPKYCQCYLSIHPSLGLLQIFEYTFKSIFFASLSG